MVDRSTEAYTEMIEKNVKIHDKFQFEIKLGYKIKKNQDKNAYLIDTFFFIPYSLGINSQTYSKDVFYKDIHGYIRLKTPTLLLRQIVNSESSPLTGLKKSIETLVAKRDKPSKENYEYHVKMLCSIVKSSLRDHVKFTRKSSPIDMPDLVNEFISRSQALVKEYRDLKPIINVPTTSEKSLAIFRFGDEFLSQNIELYGFRLLDFIDKTKSETMAPLRERLIELVKAESRYRISCKYHAEPGEGKDLDNEVLIYRRGVLKKYIGSVLFLDAGREPEGRFLEQLLIGIAAGLSMVFATLVAFFAQKHFGNFTFPLFTLLVVSYIFKDRIKELARVYFVKKLNKSRFDHKTNIYSDERQKIGTCKEAVSFIEESELPGRIIAIRKRDHITEIENRWRGESVMVYSKQVTLFPRKMESVYKEFNIEGVNDIIRFNVNRFLLKMDNPLKKIYTLKDDKVCEINADRVYHLNLIIRIAMDEKTLYKRIRITFNRSGILRIEEVAVE